MKRIPLKRHLRELSPEQLAEIAELNIRNVQRIEAGEINLLLTTTVRLARALGFPLERLVPKE